MMTHADAANGPAPRVATHRPRTTIVSFDIRRALIPASLLVFFALWSFGVPRWALGVFMLWIPIYYIGAPVYGRFRWDRFERQFATLFPRRDYPGLLSLYRRQWFLRMLGPEAPMLAKLGLIYRGMGRLRDAERLFERAAKRGDRATRARVLLNLAHVKYELAKYKEAEQIYTRLLKKTPHLSGAKVKLAVIHAHMGKELESALSILQSEVGRSDSEEKKRIDEAIQIAEGKLAS